jgi:hypothetical protein
MNIIDEKLQRETNEFINVPDAEEYQYKSALVKELYAELRSMATQYYDWGLQRRHGGDNVIQAMANLKAKGFEKKKILIKTIEDIKKSEEEAAARDHQKKSTDRQLSIAEQANSFALEANEVSKVSNEIAKESLSKAEQANSIAMSNAASAKRANLISILSAVVAIFAIGISIWKDSDIQSKVNVAVTEAINEKFIEDLALKVQKKNELSGFTKEYIKVEVSAELQSKIGQELKEKVAKEVSDALKKKFKHK